MFYFVDFYEISGAYLACCRGATKILMRDEPDLSGYIRNIRRCSLPWR